MKEHTIAKGILVIFWFTIMGCSSIQQNSEKATAVQQSPSTDLENQFYCSGIVGNVNRDTNYVTVVAFQNTSGKTITGVQGKFFTDTEAFPFIRRIEEFTIDSSTKYETSQKDLRTFSVTNNEVFYLAILEIPGRSRYLAMNNAAFESSLESAQMERVEVGMLCSRLTITSVTYSDGTTIKVNGLD